MSGLLEPHQAQSCGFTSPPDALRDQSKEWVEFRPMNEKPYNVLKVEGYTKDLYTRSLDVSSEGILASVVSKKVFLSSHGGSKIQKLSATPGSATAVKFMNRTEALAVGTAEGHLVICDLHKEKTLTVAGHHSEQITSIDFIANGAILSTGLDSTRQ